MKRYLKLFKIYYYQSLMQAMEYKQNLLIWMGVDCLWTLLDGIMAYYLMTNIDHIGNWDLYRTLIAIGMFRLIAFPFWSWFVPAFADIPKIVNSGRLDQFLTKPIDSQVLVSIQKFSFHHLSSLVGGVIFLMLGLRGLNFVFWPNIIFDIWMYLISIILVYSVFFLTMSMIFANDRTENLHNLFSEIFYATSRYPRDIYPIVLQRILMTFFPITLMVTVPAQVLFGEFEPLIIIWFHFLAVVFFVVSRLAWKYGLKRYSSASS